MSLELRSLAGFLRRLVARATMLALCVPAAGCVQRRFTVRSNPPGALAIVDDYEIGTTPVSHDFVYYGKRKIQLVKDGYETLTVIQPIQAPWYEWFPLDFISENLVPGEIRDQRTIDFQLTPQVIVPTDQLLTRAEDLRRNSSPPVGGAPPVIGPPPGMGPPPSVGGSAGSTGTPLPLVAPPATGPALVPQLPMNTQPPMTAPPGYLSPPALAPPPGLPPAPITPNRQPSYTSPNY